MFSLAQIEEQVATAIDTVVFPGQDTYEEAIPDIHTLHRGPNGHIVPYVAYQLGDAAEWGASGFAGPRSDDYLLPIRFQIVSPTPTLGRQLRTFALDRFLGLDFDWAGQIRKSSAGGDYAIKNSDGAVECYMYPSGFNIVVQLSEIPEP